jgi:hypothetical protein
MERHPIRNRLGACWLSTKATHDQAIVGTFKSLDELMNPQQTTACGQFIAASSAVESRA